MVRRDRESFPYDTSIITFNTWLYMFESTDYILYCQFWKIHQEKFSTGIRRDMKVLYFYIHESRQLVVNENVERASVVVRYNPTHDSAVWVQLNHHHASDSNQGPCLGKIVTSLFLSCFFPLLQVRATGNICLIKLQLICGLVLVMSGQNERVVQFSLKCIQY